MEGLVGAMSLFGLMGVSVIPIILEVFCPESLSRSLIRGDKSKGLWSPGVVPVFS